MKHHSEGFLAIVNDAKKRIREIDIEEYKRLREAGEAGQLVDVREDHEWQAAHAAGAIHLSKGIIERDIEKTFRIRMPSWCSIAAADFVGSRDRQSAEDGL